MYPKRSSLFTPLLMGLLLSSAPGAASQVPTDTSFVAQPTAERVYSLPFGEKNITLRLAVANRADVPVGDVRVAVEQAPAWIRFRSTGAASADIGPAADKPAFGEVSFTFEVAPGAPVGETGTVLIRTGTAGGPPTLRALAFEVAPPEAVRLLAPFPNPASGVARIAYELPAEGAVRLEAFDVLGRRVATVAAEDELEPGRHTATWAVGGVTPGLYVLRLAYDGPAGREVATERLTVVR